MTLGERIGSMRKARGLTQEALSEMMDVTPQAVSKWECSQSCPDIMALPRLARILGCSIDELLTGETPDVKEVDIVEGVEPEVLSSAVPSVVETKAVATTDVDSIVELEITATDDHGRKGLVSIEMGEGASSFSGSVSLMERENGKVYLELEEGSEFHLILSRDSRLESLSVETVASDVLIEGLSLRKLDVDTVSGDISIKATAIETKADLNTVAGTIFTKELRVDRLDAESVSGLLEVDCEAQHKISAGTVSGTIHLESGFTRKVSVETVSGNAEVLTLNSSPEIHFESMMGNLVAGDYPKPHDMKIVADTVSGRIKVDTVKYN